MGQNVSYLYGSCEAEKEESSYDHPNLLTGPLVAPPSLVSSIGSSADGAVHQFMANDSGITVMRHRRKVYRPRWNSCSDEALQQDQLNSPPTAIPSPDSCTIETLLQELLIAPPTVVPSLGPSTHETLQPDEIISPPTMVPNIDPSTNEALQQDVLTFPPTLVPSINSSTNKALQHHDLIITPSTVVLSVDSRSNDGLHHDLVIAPSTVVPSINSGIDEAFDQFNGIYSAIKVLVDKWRVDQVNEDLEKKKSRKVKKKKHEDKLCKNVVQLERKIKHYSSSQKILLVGEGDFSFSACLAMFFGSASNMVATSLDSKAFLKTNYKNAKSNICELRSRGCKVMHSVDATEMAYNSLLNYLIFDRIIYNFPLVGFFPGTSRKKQLKWNRKLVLQFLDNAKELISENGEIHITHKSWGFFLEWNLQQLASQVGLRLIEEVPFKLKDYKGYNTKYGFGGDDNFDCNPSKTYKFGLKLRKHS